MKMPQSLVAVLVIVALLSLLQCAAEETPESRRIAEINKEVDEINKKMEATTDLDERQTLSERKMELMAEQKNILQKADKTRRSE